jgi:hypothetical protein
MWKTIWARNAASIFIKRVPECDTKYYVICALFLSYSKELKKHLGLKRYLATPRRTPLLLALRR